MVSIENKTDNINTMPKLNKSQKLILKLFIGDHKSLSAGEIVKSLKEVIDRATVYRNLNFLINNNILEQIQLIGEVPKYELSAQDHHHHLICRKCNNIRSISSKSLEIALLKLQEETDGFTITEHVFEFYGLCNKCKKDEK